LDAVKGNIYQILNGAKQFVIPVYQRTYSWEREHCQRLWSDIVDMQKSGREGHFVGSIVNIAEKDMPVGVQKYMIIDGQQRLTTLTLLLIALRNYAKTHEESGVNAKKITDTLLLNVFELDDDRYKLLLTQTDRIILIKLIEEAPLTNEEKSRLIDNHAFFTEQIEKNILLPVEIYESIGKLQIVNITLDRQSDDPQAIFESLNSTGIDLKDSDLVRNHILMGLDTATQIDVYNNIWRPTEVLFDYKHQSELLDNFFRDYLTMKLGNIPKKNEVYKEFRDYHKNCNIPIRELCQDIYKFAKYYADMQFCKSDDIILKSLYEEVKAIRMDVAYPFLLKIHDDFHKGIISKEVMVKIIQFCVSYVLRRAICDLSTSSLNKTFATMKNYIYENDYLNSVKAFFILLDLYKQFPTDKQFISIFLTRDIYNMNRCRYILERLEKWNNKSIVLLDNQTIEHIIPQNSKLSTEWITALGSNWSEIQRKYMHTIGNLTLTAYNSEMSDSSFAKKLDMAGGFKESALRLNKYVISQTTWGEEQINERAKQLGEIAINAWPYPVLSENELVPYCTHEDSTSQYSLESYDQLNAYNRILFEKLSKRILNLGTYVKQGYTKTYVSYKVDTIIAAVFFQKEKLRICVGLSLEEIIDPKNLCRINNNWNPAGNVEMFLDSLDSLDDVMAIIEQVFRSQDIG